MTSVLGLPLETALTYLKQSGAGDVFISVYTAPRVSKARGTLRVVREEDGGRRLTVCAFCDDVNMETNDEAGTDPA